MSTWNGLVAGGVALVDDDPLGLERAAPVQVGRGLERLADEVGPGGDGGGVRSAAGGAEQLRPSSGSNRKIIGPRPQARRRASARRLSVGIVAAPP